MEEALGYVCRILVKFDSPICQSLVEALGSAEAAVTLPKAYVDQSGISVLELCLKAVNASVVPKGITVGETDVCVIIQPLTQSQINQPTPVNE